MAQTSAQGGMDITDQRQTFHGFLTATVWTCTLIGQSVLLLTLAFAVGLGWWSGYFAFIAVGVAAGLIFKLRSVFWAVQVVLWVLLGLGGMIVPLLS